MSDTTVSMRRKIAGAGDLQSVVRTMKAVAASSIGQYEQSVRALADYYRTVELGLGACFRESGPAPLIAERRTRIVAGALGAVVFGSDQGLVGQFNDVVIDFAIKTLADLPGKPQVWAVGKRVHARLAESGLTPMGLFTVPNSVKAVTPLVGQILVESETHHPEGGFIELYLFYNRHTSGAGTCARTSAATAVGRKLAAQPGRISMADAELARDHGLRHRDFASAHPRISFRLALPRGRRIPSQRKREPLGVDAARRQKHRRIARGPHPDISSFAPEWHRRGTVRRYLRLRSAALRGEMMRMDTATVQRELELSCRDADTSSECNRNTCRASLNRNVPNEALLLTRQMRSPTGSLRCRKADLRMALSLSLVHDSATRCTTVED